MSGRGRGGQGRGGRWIVALGAVVCGAVALESCSATTAPSVVGPRIVQLDRDAGEGIAPVDPGRGEVVGAGQLRLLLEELLGVHGTLTTEMMRLALLDDEALPAWMEALAANTEELSAAIGLVYGPAGARAFDQLWSFHTQFFLTYADGRRRGDDAAVAEAIEGLADYRADFSSFIATATGGAAPSDAVAQLLGTHIDHMIGQLDAFGSGDIAGSLATERAGHDYLATIGKTLAGAIAAQDPVAFPGEVDDPVTAFCSIGASKMTSLADSVVASVVLPTRFASGDVPEAWDQALTAHRASALAELGETQGSPVESVSDLVGEGDADALIELFLHRIPSPTAENEADAAALAAFGPQMAVDLFDPLSLPVIVRNAYATAYRLAAAGREG